MNVNSINKFKEVVDSNFSREKIDAKNAACGPIDTPQYDTPNWSYGGVIQGDCENYIDPEIEQQITFLATAIFLIS